MGRIGMKMRVCTGLGVIALVVAGCSGIRVSQDYDPDIRFPQLTTFAWTLPAQEKTGDPRIDNPLLDARIRAAIVKVLATKGFHGPTTAPPSFTVRYRYLLQPRLNGGGGSGIHFGIGSFGGHGGIAIGTGTTIGDRSRTDASLIIDVLDPTSGALLWRGTGTEPYRDYDSPDTATTAVDTLVERILAPFPPEAPATTHASEAS
jgi:hypothetical protein